MGEYHFTPEVKQVPEWAHDTFSDHFFEMDLTYGGRRRRSPEQVDRLIERVRRRQFNANRDTWTAKREIELVQNAESAVKSLVEMEPEMAEAFLRQLVETTLGGRVLVPKATRKINKDR